MGVGRRRLSARLCSGGERAAAAIALGGLAVFLALASFDVRVPGLYYDELFQLTTSLAFVKGGLGSAVAWVPGTEISLAGHPLPLMAHSYIGAVKTVAFVPVAAVFGISPASVRVFTISVAGLSLLFTYLFARRLFRSPLIAALGTVLLATDPSFVFYSRIDFGPSVFMFLLKAIGLWLLVGWWRSGRLRSLVLGSFAFGLGVYDKANFIWIVAAVALAAVLLDYRGVRRRLDRRALSWAVGAFVLGCLPFLAYNASWPPRTIKPALEGTLHVSGGNPSGNPFVQFGLRVQQLVRLLDGETLSEILTGRHGGPPLLPVLALVAAAAIAILYAITRSRGRFRSAMFVVVWGVLVLAASALTPGGSYPHHVLLCYPAPHLALAAFVVGGVALLRRRARVAAQALGAVAIAAALAVSVTTSAEMLSRIRETGGIGNFSDSIYTLERDLVQHDRSRRLVVIDWGIFQNLVALSGGDLRATELWQPLNAKGRVRGSVLKQLDDPSVSYVFHAPDATNFPRARNRFFAALRRSGRHARLERTVPTRLGKPLFEVYRVS
jgi:4-amino-4-deoxy-L-arabinose transferase-like glycosyltransferase